MSALQQYQEAFAAHIRDPARVARPTGVPARRLRVYAEIVFNNMEATLAACFPVLRRILKARRWRRLVRDFLAQHRCGTPWFHQIPAEFVAWLQSGPPALDALPPFLPCLAHYEWMELAIAVADVADAPHQADGDLLAGRPVLAASLAVLEYPYPVQRIAPRFQPAAPDAEPTRLLMFRAADGTVRFIEINAVTACLLRQLQPGVSSGRAVLQRIADELGHVDREAVVSFGTQILQELRVQGAILGAAR